MSARAEQRHGVAAWSDTQGDIRGSLASLVKIAPSPNSAPARILTPRERRLIARGRRQGLYAGYLVGAVLGFVFGAGSVLLLVALR